MQGWRKGYTRYRTFFLDIYRVYRTRRDLKMYLEILLSLVTISFFGALALKPTVLTITQLLEEIQAKEEIVEITDRKIKDLGSAQNLYRTNSLQIGLLNQALPDNPSPESFARQIEGISLKDGVFLNNVIMGDVVLSGEAQTSRNSDLDPLPEGSAEVSFSLNATGGYANLQIFLRDLENMRRPMKVDYAVISVAQSAENKTITMSVSGRIPYFLKK